MPRTTDAPTDADLDRLIARARVSWGRAGDHYPASLDGFSYEAAVREADEAHRTIADLAGALAALRAELAEARPVVAAAEAHRAAYVAWHDWRPAAGMGHGHADRYAETREALLAALAARDGGGEGGVEGVELPRDYMARCAQHGTRAIFQYREELLAGLEHLRFIGAEFVDYGAARRWDDRPGNLDGWWSFPTWAAAEAWLVTREELGEG